MSINRVVALLTPLVFAPLAGVSAAWLAEHFPGVEIRAADLQEIFIAGAIIGLAPALQWLHGWQKHEARVAAAAERADRANLAAGGVDEEAEAEELDDDVIDDDFGDEDLPVESEQDATVDGLPVAGRV